jgi:hypothetical protein
MMTEKELMEYLRATHVGKGQYGLIRQCMPPNEREAIKALWALRSLIEGILEDFDAAFSGSGIALGSECSAIADHVALRVANWKGLCEQ